MANYKRKKPRRSCKCTMCTKLRWLGNSAGRKRISDIRNVDKAKSYESLHQQV
jgi:hypothetical protein